MGDVPQATDEGDDASRDGYLTIAETVEYEYNTEEAGRTRDDVTGLGEGEEDGQAAAEPTPRSQRRRVKPYRDSSWRRSTGLLYATLPVRLMSPGQQADPSLQAELAHPLNHPPDSAHRDVESMLTIGNVVWAILFGWPFYLFYGLVSILMLMTIVGRPYAGLCWKLKNYFFWPFGKYITRKGKLRSLSIDDEEKVMQREDSTLVDASVGVTPKGTSGSRCCATLCSTIAYCLWVVSGAVIVSILHCVAFILCWMSVVAIPMSKVNQSAIWLLFKRPLELEIRSGYKNPKEEIMLYVYQATNFNYYRFQVQGLNVVLVNLLPFIVLTLILGYLVPEEYRPPPMVIFATSLLSISPIAYYIGMAVASIAAQTNFAIGAMLTAIFGVSIEIILYSMAIYDGGLITLVQAGVVGSLLGDLLLLPGLSMIAGGIKYHEQSFSPTAAGVSSVLLIVSIIGVFAPTIYWQVNGDTTFSCDSCTGSPDNASEPLSCNSCHYSPVDLYKDELFHDRAQPFIYAVAAILPLGYIVGLFFTLKTHSYIFQNSESAEHEAPKWSKLKAIIVLAVSIVLFSLVAEELVKSIEPTLEDIGIEQTFAGVTIMALVPSSAEYVNAITFALNNNVALSLEIGAVSAVQISQIMLPVLVLVSGIIDGSTPILIFPLYSAFAVVFAVIIVNYISIEGKTNYFRGASLVVVYCLFVVGFYFHSGSNPEPAHR